MYIVTDTRPVPVSLTDHELNTNADPVISLTLELTTH